MVRIEILLKIYLKTLTLNVSLSLLSLGYKLKLNCYIK